MDVKQQKDNLSSLFLAEKRIKKTCYVKLNQAIVKDHNHVFSLELGTCVAVILSGKDIINNVWIGVNHLFRNREENTDIALEHVAGLYNQLTEKNVKKIHCIGVFGAGYSPSTVAKNVATTNIKTILEALSIFNLSVEVFQTGFRQGLTILASDARQSFLIKHTNITKNKSRIIELPFSRLFE